MKHFALLASSLIAVLVFTSCSCGSPFSLCGKKINLSSNKIKHKCSSCAKKQTFPHQGCESCERYAEKEVTEYVEEQIVIEGKSAKGGKGGLTTETITVRRPVTHTVRTPIPCGDCGSKFCATPDCCGIVPISVLSRATVQGGTGEPHVGNIPTMKVLVDGARGNSEL